MKIIIVANTIYPHNQPRAFRATELAKEFANLGHEVHLYGVLGTYNYNHFENKHNIHVHNIGNMNFYPYNSDGERYSISNKLISNDGYSIYNKIKTKLAKFLQNYFAYPIFEYTYKVFNLINVNNNIDLLITLAPAHSIHWGAAFARKFTKNFPKVWIADCGDPFMGLGNSKYASYFKYIENFTFDQADWITIPLEEARTAYTKRIQSKIKIIPQGYNFNDVKIINNVPNNDILTFIYAGIFYNEIRDPVHFIEYLSDIDLPFKFKLFTIENDLVKNYKKILSDKLEINNIVPRSNLFTELSKADFLVNFNNKWKTQSPSKLIDYSLAKRPILNIKHDVLDKNIINEFLNRNYNNQFIINNLDQYNIKNVVSKFLDLYENT